MSLICESAFFSLSGCQYFLYSQTTVCIINFDQGSKTIIFKSILTAFVVSIILDAAGAVAKISSSLKLNHHKQI